MIAKYADIIKKISLIMESNVSRNSLTVRLNGCILKKFTQESPLNLQTITVIFFNNHAPATNKI